MLTKYYLIAEKAFRASILIVFLFLSSIISGSLAPDIYPKKHFPKSFIQLKDSVSILDSINKDSTDANIRYENIKNKLKEKLTVIHNEEPDTKSNKTENNINAYSSLQGKIIRNIRFKQMEIFGQSVKDTTLIPEKWMEKLGNSLHIHTQSYILRNQLIIKHGKELDLYELTENERLIRDLPYISDAYTIVKEVGSDSVDILIITKDVLPLGFGMEIFDVAYGRMDFFDKNLLGLGHEINYNLTWNYNRNPFYGHRIRYRVQNIGNSFFSLDASYENSWNIESRKIYINRDFFSQSTKYAGGIGFEKTNSIIDIIYPDSITRDVKVDYNYYDYWFGRALKLKGGLISKSRTNIALTARVMQYEFFKRPEVNEELLYDFHNRTIFLTSIGLSKQGYYKTNFVFGFGRTEDIPFGYALWLTSGMEYNEFYRRPYIAFNFAHGAHIRKIGYLRKQVAFGSFINNKPEQALLLTQLNYFSDLLNRSGKYHYRVFADILYKAGYNRFSDEYMEFTKREGIRGLTSQDLRGNQKLNLSIEPVCYSPHHILGFRFVYYLFIDVGMIANESTILVNNTLYSGFGGGVRIRNDNLVFDAIHLRIGYYPILPAEADPEYILLTSSSIRRPSNFVVPKPDILRYQNRM